MYIYIHVSKLFLPLLQGTGTVDLRGYPSAVLCGPEPIPRASDTDPQALAEIRKAESLSLFNTSTRVQSRVGT